MDFIENCLKVMKFYIKDIDKNNIQFVNMCDYSVSTNNKPLLLTVNLQSCIALIAYNKNFSFLAHMNVYRGNWGEDFETNNQNEVIRCKKVDDLYREILQNKNNIDGNIKIGLVYGVSPVDKDYESRKILEKDLLQLFSKLRAQNISAIRIPDINSFSFILDSNTGTILHDGIVCNNKTVDLENTIVTIDRESLDDKEK